MTTGLAEHFVPTTAIPGENEHRRNLIAFQHAKVVQLSNSRRRHIYLHKYVNHLLRHHILPGSRVLDVGCGDGSLLGSLASSRGVGIDLSAELVEQASQTYPGLCFKACAIEDFAPEPGETFDYIVFSGVLQQLYDVHSVLQKVRGFCHPRTRLIICTYSRVWQPAIRLAEGIKFKCPVPDESWIPPGELDNLLDQSDFELIRRQPAMLMPAGIPVVSRLMNRWIAPLPLIRQACLLNITIARPVNIAAKPGSSLSIIVPLRNEAGNVGPLLKRIAKIADRQEVIFIEGHSTDNTWEVINRAIADYQGDLILSCHQQTGKGKRDAVRLGFSKADGEVVAILDGDISVPPEELPRFYELIRHGKCEFANGSRLVYPMEAQAMQFLNMIANKCFGYMFSYLLGQSVRDTLCGTKVLSRDNYERIAANRAYFGDFDPFGDFDLLFGAARQNLKIMDVPVHYKQRVYGKTNISRFSHGLLLLRMCGFAARKLCFV